MAVVDEVVSLLGQLLTISSTILTIVSQMKALGGTSDKFSSDMEDLHDQFTLYQELVQKHGERVNPRVVKTLQKARKILNQANSDMNGIKEDFDRNTCCRWWLYFKLHRTGVANKLDKAVATVKGDFKNLLEIMEEEGKAKRVFQENADLQPISTRITNNNDLYVPIQGVQTEVLKAVEDFGPDGRQIVLLYGGVGKGKSTLARYVHQLCAKPGPDTESRSGQDIERRSSQDTKGKSVLGTEKKFQYVLLVNCAGSSKSDASNKQLEILRHLSPDSLAANPDSKKSDFKDRTAASLRDFFSSGKRILVIFDDVSDRGFISEMLKASEGCRTVKYLVTSQYHDLCMYLTKYCFPIRMVDPLEGEAMEILASLVGLQDKVIPDPLKDIATKMIRDTGANPLALACLASSLTSRKTDVRAWEDTHAALRETLDRPDNAIVLGHSRDQTAGQAATSLMAAMKLCVDSLESKDAKDILLLMYGTQGESVPEAVLRILHPAMTTPSRLFHESIEELRSRELVKGSSSTLTARMNVDGNDPQGWSLLTTVKLYIDKYVADKEKISSVFGALLSDDEIVAECIAKHEGDSQIQEEKTKVAVALCALFFDAKHDNKVVAKAIAKACNASKIDWASTLKERRRKAIEPLIWLLDERQKEHLGWTEVESIHCARQVFLKYVCDRELDDNSICVLLKLTSFPLAQLATLIAIADILAIEETLFLKKDRLTFLEPLLHLLRSKEGVRPSIQKAASYALQFIAENAQNDETKEVAQAIVSSTPRLLSTLVSSLKDSLATTPTPQSQTLAQNAVSTLWCLSYGGGDIVRVQICKEDGALPALASSLLMDRSSILQERAVGALANLFVLKEELKRSRLVNQDGVPKGLVAASSRDHNLKLQVEDDFIVNLDAILPGLLGALLKDHNPELQVVAAKALCNLAVGWEPNKTVIVNQEGALPGLVGALLKDDNPHLQVEAAKALLSLAAGGGSTETVIVNHDGALPGLVGALLKDHNPELQVQAAWALSNLAARESTKNVIVNQEGALPGLVGSLLKDNNPELQVKAAKALVNLAAGEESVKSVIVNQDGALPGLLGSLLKDHNPELQKEAAWALSNLAIGNQSTKIVIVNQKGALPSLVAALLKDHNSELQVKAAKALLNLAAGGGSTETVIVNQDGALPSLVGALLKDNNPELQVQAAWALSNLAATESTKIVIVNQEGALAGLVGAVLKDHNPELQVKAAKALLNLVTGGGSTETVIVNHEGALPSLVGALLKDNNPELQLTVANALLNLSAGGESVKSVIVNQEGALPGLVGALLKDNNPKLQVQAAWALSNLATGKKSTKTVFVNVEGALRGLVGALLKDHNPELQVKATNALVNLAGGGESTTTIIVNQEGALPGLLKALLKDHNPELQVTAAKALLNLAGGGESTTTIIVHQEGALPGLVGALLKDHNPELQVQAAWALSNLATGKEPTKAVIVNQEGALPGLVGALLKDHNPELQVKAAKALVNLAAGGESTTTVIVHQEGALAGLVGAVLKDHNPELQIGAAWALSNLATGKESTKTVFVNQEGALPGLVGALLKDHNPELQVKAANALLNLAAGGESTTTVIANQDGALPGLVGALLKDNNPVLQIGAAWALSNLARGKELTKTIIVNQEGALAGLVGALLKDNNPELQMKAAKALVNLSGGADSTRTIIGNQEGALRGIVATKTEDRSILLTMRSEEGLLAALAMSAAKEDNPDLANEVKKALENLGEATKAS